MASKVKLDKAYVDPKGTGIHYRKPDEASDFQKAAKSLSNLKKTANKSKGKNVPQAMAIYEPWMEPGWNGDVPKDKQLKFGDDERPDTPDREPQKRNPKSKYKYDPFYSDQVSEEELKRKEEEERQKKVAEENERKEKEERERREQEYKEKQEQEKKEQLEKEKAERKREEEEQKERKRIAREEERERKIRDREEKQRLAEEKQRQEEEERRQSLAEALHRPTIMEPPKSDSDESDYEPFTKWVMNGRDDDTKKSQKLLFETRKKKAGRGGNK